MPDEWMRMEDENMDGDGDADDTDTHCFRIVRSMWVI